MSKVPKAAPSTAVIPADLQKQMDQEIAEIQKRIGAPSGDMIKWSAGTGFTAPDGSSGATLNAVVLDFMSSNLYYDKPYVEGEPGAPACFAIGREPSLLTPSESAPSKQSDTCGRCQQNEFGSSANGKGKACRNHRLLAVMPVGDEASLPDAEAPIWLMKLPPTSLKAFDSFVANLAARRMLPVQVAVEIGTDATAKWANYAFAPKRLLDNDELRAYMGRRSEAMQRLEREPDVSQYVAPAPRKGARR